MEFVTKSSLLETYLNVNTYTDVAERTSTPIFPFGCNRSQYKAVRNALEHKLSVIQGPPGTGKTQTILNILSNLLIAGKTMEIVSNNNSAVENIKEKLEASGLGFICAQLGRFKNKSAFFESQTGVLAGKNRAFFSFIFNIRLNGAFCPSRRGLPLRSFS